MILWISSRLMAAARALAAIFILLLASLIARAQALSVLPVNVFLQPGQKAAALTVTNRGDTETSIQIRAYAWNQKDNNDQLTSSNAVLVSPPLVSIAPGAVQVIRLILRSSPQGQEATYRILIDQIPPPAEPGIVHVVLRLSIPIFAMPTIRTDPHVQFHVECNAGQIFLVGINGGLRHEVIRDIVLSTSDGRKLKEESGASPYILAGATRRWLITAQGPLPLPDETLQLRAHANDGTIEQQVRVVAGP